MSSGFYHLKHDDALKWCWFSDCRCFVFHSLSFSRNRWMQDYRCDFRQRLDRTADALSGRVRGKHGRHRQGKWAWWIRQGLSTPVCMCGAASSKALVNLKKKKKSTILRNNVFIFALLKELSSAFFILTIIKSFCFQRSWNNLPKRFSSSSFNNLKSTQSAPLLTVQLVLYFEKNLPEVLPTLT